MSRKIGLTTFTIKQLKDEMRKTKYVLYDNLICDVGEFINHHPGGKNLISDNLYTDVGRYITGTQAYSSKFLGHDHRFMTYRHLINKLAYGEIVEDHRIILDNRNSSYTLGGGMGNLTFIKKRAIAENTYEFSFSDKNLKFARFLPGHIWIGRHFSVTSGNLNKTRYYSLCLGLDEKIKEAHQNLLLNLSTSESLPVEIKENDLFSKNLHLYIKRYQHKDALSDYIHHKTNDILIKGPLVIYNLIFRVLD